MLGLSRFRKVGLIAPKLSPVLNSARISTTSFLRRNVSLSKYEPPSSLILYNNRQVHKSHSLLAIRAMSSSGPRKDGDDNQVSSNKRNGMLASAALFGSVLIGKTKYLLVALKLTKAMPLASMVITSFAYSLFFGWQYAVGMVGLIFFHECGHALVMKQYNVPFSPMVFVPFMGAVIAMKEEPRNAYEEAMIAFGGPVLGSVAALGAGMAGTAMDSQLLIALADFGYMINLFNLLPIGSMDGGRITNAVSPYFGVAGLAGGAFMIYHSLIVNPIFYLIMLGGTYSTGMRVFKLEEKENKDYYNIPRSQQGAILAGYAGLICALIMAMRENNKHRKTPRQLQAEKEGVYFQQEEDPWAVGAQKDGVYDDFFKDK